MGMRWGETELNQVFLHTHFQNTFSLNLFIFFWMNWLIYFVLDNFEKFDHEGRKMKV